MAFNFLITLPVAITSAGGLKQKEPHGLAVKDPPGLRLNHSITPRRITRKRLSPGQQYAE